MDPTAERLSRRLTFRRIARAAEAHIAEHQWRLTDANGERLPLPVELEVRRQWLARQAEDETLSRPTEKHVSSVVSAAEHTAARRPTPIRVHSGRRRESHRGRPGHRRTTSTRAGPGSSDDSDSDEPGPSSGLTFACLTPERGAGS